MEAAARAAIEELAPGVLDEGLTVRVSTQGVLELAGRVDVRKASRLNIAVHRFLGESGIVSRNGLAVFVPQVRLGDVTTEVERQVLASRLEDPAYLDPERQVEAPEWNTDFVEASDRRHRLHIKPRYAVDDDDTIDAVAAFIADFCRGGRGIVAHTGAGISAAAGIATYREGSSESLAIDAAMPTYAHYALVALTLTGHVDYVCSQNVDGLHRRSGLAAGRLSELHGNSYIETCSCCQPPMEFVRPFDVYSTRTTSPKYWACYVAGPDGQGRRIVANVELTSNERASGIHHITGRACPNGGGPLRDSIIHFGEGLPAAALEEGERRAKQAPLNLVVGSSLLVRPASGLPFAGAGPVAIVAKTCTGSDIKALRRGGVLLRADADVVLERLARHVGVELPHTPELVRQLGLRVRARDQAVLRSDGSLPYDGGADGGVFPASLLVPRPAPAPSPSPAAALCLRQTHLATPDGLHRWTLGLEAADGGTALSRVASVRFMLHPAFDPPVHVVARPPFVAGPFLGWGTFDVKVDVEFMSEQLGLPKLSVDFPLSFDRDETVQPLVVAAAAA